MPPRGSCVLGFAPHSGWAAVVVIGGTPGNPLVLARERLELADAGLPGAKQPYHAIESLPLAQAAGRLAAFRAWAAERLPCTRIRQRDLPAEAARALKRTPEALTATVARLARHVGSPWGADQKGAALIAWLLLARAA